MYLSAKKYLEESAKSATSGADQLIRHTSVIINTVKVYEKCHKCNAQVSALNNYLTSQNTCRMCCKIFCNSCIAKTAVNVPNHYLDITYQNKTAHAQPERQYLCLHRCTPRVVNACMFAFRKEITSRFEEYVNSFLSDEQKQHFFFNIPEASPEDTAYRKALRMIHIAGVVAGMTGYAMTYNAVKYAYYSSELVNILTEGGILGILTPLLESLKECGIGITGPTAMMRLYYLGCYHTLQSKIDNSRRSALYESHLPGVIYSECPLAVLEYVNGYLSAAQWMYLSSLPPPHQDNDWGSWYLSQIIRRQGWSLLMCINDSTKIPDGSKCPAFALVTRCIPATACGGSSGDKSDTPSSPPLVKEAMLVIRGSSTVMDWSINLEDEMCDYVFTHIVDNASTSGVNNSDTPSVDATTGRINATTPNPIPTTDRKYTSTVQGIIHKGLHTAALGLLDGYNLRTTLLRLIAAGYTVKVVGHSLGAGIAALIAAELRVSLIVQHLAGDTTYGTQDNTTANISTNMPDLAEPTSPTATRVGISRPESGQPVSFGLTNAISAVSAVVFSSPAFLSVNLADAFLVDKLLVNVVYDKDIIPRFSFKTIQVMAEELKDPDFCAQADKWTLQDKSDFSDYAVSMGKAADIHKPVYGEGSADEPSTTEGNQNEDLVTDSSTTATTTTATSAAAVPSTAPAKPSKPPKSEKPPSSSTSTKIDTTSTPTVATAEPTSASNTSTKPASATANSSGSTWGGFMTSLAATALDKYQQVQAQQQAQQAQQQTQQKEASTADSAKTDSTSTGTDSKSTPTEAQPSSTPEPDSETKFAEQTAHAVSSSSSSEVTQKAARAHTVTPGPIIHLYKENDGTVHGAVVTHLHSSFQRMEIIPAHSADDHLMAKVREGMKSALFQHQLLTHSVGSSGSHKGSITIKASVDQDMDKCDLLQEASEEVNESAAERAKFDTYFNIPLSDRSVKNVPSAVAGDVTTGFCAGAEEKKSSGLPAMPAKVHRSISSEGQQIPGLSSNTINSNTTTTTTTTSISAASATAVATTAEVVNPAKSSISIKGTLSCGGDSSKHGGTTPSKPAAVSSNAASAHGNVGLAAQQWVNCSVCTLDVTWPYVLHSDASRAIVAHNCRKCGEVVCSMCAPAGDSLPGDGLNQSYKLEDYRVSLPERGLFSPQRVCVLCYFDT